MDKNLVPLLLHVRHSFSPPLGPSVTSPLEGLPSPLIITHDFLYFLRSCLERSQVSVGVVSTVSYSRVRQGLGICMLGSVTRPGSFEKTREFRDLD